MGPLGDPKIWTMLSQKVSGTASYNTKSLQSTPRPIKSNQGQDPTAYKDEHTGASVVGLMAGSCTPSQAKSWERSMDGGERVAAVPLMSMRKQPKVGNVMGRTEGDSTFIDTNMGVMMADMLDISRGLIRLRYGGHTLNKETAVPALDWYSLSNTWSIDSHGDPLSPSRAAKEKHKRCKAQSWIWGSPGHHRLPHRKKSGQTEKLRRKGPMDTLARHLGDQTKIQLINRLLRTTNTW